MIESTLGAVAGRELLLSLVQGLALGLPASALFFAGLAWGMRRALASSRPALILLASFFVRAALLSGLGLLLVRMAPSSSHALAALLAYVLAFVLVRFLVTNRAERRNAALQADHHGSH